MPDSHATAPSLERLDERMASLIRHMERLESAVGDTREELRTFSSDVGARVIRIETHLGIDPEGPPLRTKSATMDIGPVVGRIFSNPKVLIALLTVVLGREAVETARVALSITHQPPAVQVQAPQETKP